MLLTCSLGRIQSSSTPRTISRHCLSHTSATGMIIGRQLVIAGTAAWIGKRAAAKGRKPLLLLGFGVLPIRGVLYTLTHAAGALIAIQPLDGVANAIFGIVSILVVKDRMQGTGRF